MDLDRVLTGPEQARSCTNASGTFSLRKIGACGVLAPGQYLSVLPEKLRLVKLLELASAQHLELNRTTKLGIAGRVRPYVGDLSVWIVQPSHLCRIVRLVSKLAGLASRKLSSLHVGAVTQGGLTASTVPLRSRIRRRSAWRRNHISRRQRPLALLSVQVRHPRHSEETGSHYVRD